MKMTDNRRLKIAVRHRDILFLALALIVALFGLSSSLITYIIPGKTLQGSVVSVGWMLGLLIVITNRKMFLRHGIMILLMGIMILFPWTSLRTSDWGIITVLYFCVLMTNCLITMYNMEIVRLSMPLMLAAYIMYAVCTIWFYLDRRFYMSNIISLFPDYRARLINMYNSGCMAGLTYHYSVNGMFLATGLIMAYAGLLVRKSLKNWALFLLFVVGLLLTGKRGHLLFAVCACFYIYYCDTVSNRGRAGKRLMNTIGVILILSAAGAIVVSYVPAFSVTFYRFQRAMESGDISNGRYGLWRLAWATFKAHPLTGIGWKNFATQISPTYSSLRKYDVHNVYLQLLCEVGIFGTVVYIGSMLYCFVTCGKLLRLMKRIEGMAARDRYYILFSLGFQSFFLLYCITGNPLYERIMLLPYLASCGITLYYRRICKKEVIQ